VKIFFSWSGNDTNERTANMGFVRVWLDNKHHPTADPSCGWDGQITFTHFGGPI